LPTLVSFVVDMQGKPLRLHPVPTCEYIVH
jgi:hypothetical protein